MSQEPDETTLYNVHLCRSCKARKHVKREEGAAYPKCAKCGGVMRAFLGLSRNAEPNPSDH